MHYHDYETMVFGEDGENPIRPTLIRCLHEAAQADTRLKVEVRVKHLGTTSSKAEHTFIVDAKEELADTILANVKDRLDAAPGHGFEGQIRINFYASGNMATKYGSFTRQIRTATPEGYGGNPENMMGMMNNFMNQGGNNTPQNDFSGFEGMDEGREEDELGSSGFSNTEYQQNDQMQQMMKMMQMAMQAQQGGGAVDQKMAMEWLTHTMSFLFRSLALQMSMFERSTKLVETYAMRFGLPQPLEQQKPERIIREVPMELEFPDYQPVSSQQPPPAPERPSILPQLLNAAAAFAGNPGAAQLLQTAATMLNTPPPPVHHPEPPPPRPKPRIKRKENVQVEEDSPGGPRYIKQDPPRPKSPVKGVPQENWEEDEPQEQNSSDFSFGLDGSHQKINPFPQNEMFAEFEEGTEEAEDFGTGMDFNDFEDDMEVEVPEGFPDLNGLSAEEMKQTVLDWIQADPDNRKQQILEMLPELSSVIL